MIKIKPTLFIGLGSSGLEIINSVRELMYEEFLSAGFPCVRFLHVSSHTGGEEYDLPSELFTNDFEKIKVSEISIKPQQYAQVPLMIGADPRNDLKSPGLKEWLPPRLARLGNVSLEQGMKNDRKLGRLALWLNWEALVNDINAQLGMIINAANRTKTNEMLEDYHKRKGLAHNVENSYLRDGMNVFIVGTLLGGTGSGTFLDIAFYLREAYENCTIKGIFTIFDAELAGLPNNDRLAANAYSALVELDYYTQDGTAYNYLVPGTRIRKNVTNPPFNHVSIITTKNIRGIRSAYFNPDGTRDDESLHKMIGTTMFFDVVTGTGTSLDALRTNWDGQFLVPLRNPPRYIKRFSSFGAVSFWYPKSRVAYIGACDYLINKLTKNWIGDPQKSNPGMISNSADQFVNSLVQLLRTKLSGFIENGQGTTIQSNWLPIFAELNNALNAEEVNIEEMMSKLRNEPSANPLASRFKLNGYYYKMLDMNMITAKTAVNEFISSEIDNIIKLSINSVFNKNAPRFTLIELQSFSHEIRTRISNFIQNSKNLPTSNIDFSRLEPNFQALREEQERVLTSFIGAKKDIIKQHAARIADSIKDFIEEAQNTMLSFFTGEYLRNNSDEIDKLIFNRIGKILDLINKVGNIAEDKINSLSEIKQYSSLKIILSKPDIIQEAKEASKQVSDHIVNNHINQTTCPLILKNPEDSQLVFNDLIKFLQYEILKSPMIAEMKIFGNDYLDNNTLISYERNAEPMFESITARAKVPYPEGQYPTLIAGGDQESRQKAKQIINAVPGKDIKVDGEIDVDLNHLLYIYKEEAGIAISEFLTFAPMYEQYRSHNQERGTHIDQDPSKFDIERFLTNRDMREEKWFKLAQELFENYIFDEITIQDKDKKRYRINYRDNAGAAAFEYLFSSKEDEFYSLLSSKTSFFDEVKRRIGNAFLEHTALQFRTKVNEFLEKMINSGVDPDSDEFRNSRSYYDKLFATRYPENQNL